MLIKIGRVETITASGALIVSCTTLPKTQTVYDERGRRLGKVTKVLGPVSSPYIKVLPEKGNLAIQTLIGKFVYAGEKDGGQKEKGRRRGN
ncbi:MAG: Gar1/Naf1 family protein [Thermoplasmata archaeon]